MKKLRYACHRLAAVLCVTLLLPVAARAETDVLMQAINYVFTGRINPPDGPKIEERNGCVVLVPDTRNKRMIRYYLGRFQMDTARFEKIYSGRTPTYRLEVEGDMNVVEFLNPDGSVAHGHRTDQIALPGEIEQTQRALRLIVERCKPAEEKPAF